MQLLYLIGNGFDINAGLNTRYSDFYNYYINKENRDENIKCIKASINNYLSNKKLELEKINWSDLELALGQYCETFKTKKEFDIVFRDIATSLAEYLRTEELNYDIMPKTETIIFKDLLNPFKYLSTFNKDKLSPYIDKFSNSSCHINIITFNYTQTLEKIINWKHSITLGQTLKWRNSTLDSINHIHGYTFSRMVLGVNDESQINNDELLKDPYFKNAIIKSYCNIAQETNHEKDCQKLINEADVICMYGLSIGDTDKYWWNQIANSIIKKNSKLIIFAYSSQDVDGIFGYDKAEIKDNIIKSFTNKISINSDNIEKLKENIYVSINKKIFDIKLSKKVFDKEFKSQHSLEDIQDTIIKSANENPVPDKIAI